MKQWYEYFFEFSAYLFFISHLIKIIIHIHIDDKNGYKKLFRLFLLGPTYCRTIKMFQLILKKRKIFATKFKGYQFFFVALYFH